MIVMLFDNNRKLDTGEHYTPTKYWSVNFINRIRYILVRPILAVISLIGLLLSFLYITGFFGQFINGDAYRNQWGYASVSTLGRFNPFRVIPEAFSSGGRFMMPFFLILFVAAFFFIWRTYTVDKHKVENNDLEVYHEPTYGSAKWMNNQELEETFNVSNVTETSAPIIGEKQGYVVTLPNDGKEKSWRFNGHVGVVGSSGSGKTRSFLFPNLMQAAKRGDSVFITDPKGEIKGQTELYMRARGYEVKTLDLVNIEKSDSWDLLGEVTKGLKEEDLYTERGRNIIQTNIKTFTDSLFLNTKSPTDKEDFWYQTEKTLFQAICLYVIESDDFNNSYKDPSRRKSIKAVFHILSSYNLTGMSVEDNVIENSQGISHDANEEMIYVSKANLSYRDWFSFMGATETVRLSVVNGLQTRLDVLKSDTLANMLSTKDIDLEKPANEKTCYYLILSDTETTYRFISGVFFTFAFQTLQKNADNQPSKRTDIPIIFLLDEFPNVGQIPDFDKKLAVFRSRGISITFVVQTIGQLEMLFPQRGEKDTIIGNVSVLMLLGANDKETAKYFSELSGTQTIAARTYSRERHTMPGMQNTGEYRESVMPQKRPLLSIDEALRFESLDDFLVFSNQSNPVRLNKFDYEKHPDAQFFLENEFDILPKWREEMEEASARRRLREEKTKSRIPSYQKEETVLETNQQVGVVEPKKDADVDSGSEELDYDTFFDTLVSKERNGFEDDINTMREVDDSFEEHDNLNHTQQVYEHELSMDELDPHDDWDDLY